MTDLLKEQLAAYLGGFDLEKVAKESGFIKRKLRKLKLFELINGLFMSVLENKTSLRNIAISVGLLVNESISKQGIDHYFKDSLLTFLKRILSIVFSEQLKPATVVFKAHRVFEQFNQVILFDSTTIALPSKLWPFFPGASNKYSKKNATLKMQVAYEIIREQLLNFEITSFRKNDQSASADALELIGDGDLIIRDLGYFVLDVFKKIIQKNAFFISRLKDKVLIYTEDGSREINLANYIKKRLRANKGNLSPIETKVCIGKTRLPIRLVIIPLPDEVANEKRRKAKNNRDRRCNPNKESLFLEGFNIFISNIDADNCDAKAIAAIYQIRWRIEILFKAWKSYCKIDHVPHANLIRVLATIYIKLILIMILHRFAMKLCRFRQKTDHQALLQYSLLRLYSFFENNIRLMLLAIHNPDLMLRLEKQVFYHCQYDKHNKRSNYAQKLIKLT